MSVSKINDFKNEFILDVILINFNNSDLTSIIENSLDNELLEKYFNWKISSSSALEDIILMTQFFQCYL